LSQIDKIFKVNKIFSLKKIFLLSLKLYFLIIEEVFLKFIIHHLLIIFYEI